MWRSRGVGMAVFELGMIQKAHATSADPLIFQITTCERKGSSVFMVVDLEPKQKF